MPWHLHVLGCNAAIPSVERSASAQVLKMEAESFLFDCGEGTQLQIKRFGVKWMRISTIFISHCHGDHLFGLPGLLSSYSLSGRTKPLTIYGPIGIKKFIDTVLLTAGVRVPYPLTVKEHTAEEAQHVLESRNVRVSTIPMKHRVPTTGYRVEEILPPRRLIPSALDQYEVPFHLRSQLKLGADYNHDGQTIPNALLTEPNRAPITFAYCTDTAYDAAVADHVSHVDLLYHEATFAHELAELAAKRGHSTSIEAAKIAQAAAVGKLIIGHFSSRYDDLNILLEEAKSIFPASILAEDGLVISVK